MDRSLQRNTHQNTFLKKLIWAYILLWIFEGVLRKWIFPSLSTPLLVVRDPVAIALLFFAAKQGLSFINIYVRVAWIATAFSLIITLIIGHQNLFVALYGARIMFLHFPLVFIIANTFSQKDIQTFGKFILVLSPLMTILIYMQFNSPQSAWVNRGVGGNLSGAGFSGAMGYMRPPGTFSFTNGVSAFYPLTSVFLCYFWLSRSKISRYILIIATISLIIALPMTISRTAVLWTCLIIGFFIFSGLGNTKFIYPIFITSFIAVFLVILLSESALFQTTTEVFMSRFNSANENQGGFENSILSRVVRMLTGPLDNLGNFRLFEGKLGMGSNAGASLLGTGSRLVISEGELGRLFGERGLILGLVIYFVRAFLSISFIASALKSLLKQKVLSFLFTPIVVFAVYTGQWSVPSSLGFSIISCGMALASLKNDYES